MVFPDEFLVFHHDKLIYPILLWCHKQELWKAQLLQKAQIPWKASGIKMQPEKMVLKEKNTGSFLMKSRCRTDLLASIFPSCILVYFLPILLSSADLFAGFFKKCFSKNIMWLSHYTCKDTPVMTQTLCSSYSQPKLEQKTDLLCDCQDPAILKKNWYYKKS